MVCSLEDIKDWAVSFVKYKDAVMKKYSSVSKSAFGVLAVLKKGGEEKYLCFVSLDDLDVASLSDEKIICLNKKSNLDWLITNWSSLIDKDSLFIFVNPSKSESWALHPKNHHIITDKAALKSGLLSLFESVSEVK